MDETYDLIVIGGGPAGISAARLAAAKGKRTLILEKEGWGGTCTHRGCIPTKALLTCSKSYSDLKKFKRLGIRTGEAAIDFGAVKKHQQQIVRVAALGAEKTLADAGVDIRIGEGEILSASEVRYTDAGGAAQTLKTSHILIAWGSVPQMLAGVALSDRVMTSDGILGIDAVPESIVIVGASFIGVEFATLFAELGAKVTLVELLDRILTLEDDEAAALIHQELVRQGATVHTSTKLLKVSETEEGVTLRAEKCGEPLAVTADRVLLCTGRKPLLHHAQLEAAGIRYTGAGILVDEKMMTNVQGIYAAGDVTGGMMLAHRADVQARGAVGSMFGCANGDYNENAIPSVVYCHPQIARVGYTQARAAEEHLDVQVVRSPYSANLIARAELSGQGFAKALFHRERIIGATVAGEQAADLISPLALAVANGLTKRELRRWVIAHPTLSEVLGPLVSD